LRVAGCGLRFAGFKMLDTRCSMLDARYQAAVIGRFGI